MMREKMMRLMSFWLVLLLSACGGTAPPPKTPQPKRVPAVQKIVKKIVPGLGNDPSPMALIPAGAYYRGSRPRTGEPDERPRRAIVLSAFYIDQFEVSVARYRACFEAGKCKKPNQDEHCNWSIEGRDEHPINCVSWYQAQKFCAWAGKRLPTEAEWEKAARGGDDRFFSWGKHAPSCKLANFNATLKLGKDRYCRGQTVPVTEYPQAATPYGVVQMTGNVYEWVLDWYAKDFYAKGPEKDPQGPVVGKHRAIRGGSWFSIYRDIRIGLRGLVPPSIRLPYLGFRCAKTAPRAATGAGRR
jgi:formylglycine-generating enzyme required for sulfatase activity